MTKKLPDDQAFVEFAKILGINLNDPKFKPKSTNPTLDALTKALKKYGSD